MGTTQTRPTAKPRYADTNNQFAFKTDREGFLARIRSKAEELWSDGYRALNNPDGLPHTFLVWNETTGLAAGHMVNVAEGTCTCRFMVDQDTHPLDMDDPARRIRCKHLKGIKTLVGEEIDYFKRLEQNNRLHDYDPQRRERAGHYCAQWQAMQACWNAGVAANTQRRAA